MRTIRKSALGLGLAAIAGAAFLGGTVQQAAAEWQPRKPVEFIIMAGTGGGADQIARLMQGLIQQKDLSPRPFIPINKPGGSGAEALRYMHDKAGDDHTLLVTLNSFYTTPLVQENLGVDIAEFTPIARMAIDTFLLWVPADSEIDSLEAFGEKIKAEGRNWKMGGTGTGQEDSILTAMIEAEFGADITYIPYPGGGDVAKNLVGKHHDSTVNNPAEQNEFYRAGQSKPIVQFTEERMEAYPDVPTAKELGHDIVYFMQRSVNGPPGMSEEAQQWYISLFEELFNSQEWQDFCASDGLTCDEFVAGEDLAAFHQTNIERHKALIDQVGADAIVSQ
ncbi:Bug family tripartite tricarboxylate transporter substrate binding protein [Lutibaculum baratangense]|uniref:Tricarboxylate transport protein TctC n=1 Tax=Lutibaculum baratangense AMV1 TaxID=631454 RepID=V4RKX3_9HYPH|nr:tripartite tricarboxylate transporter substrate binding protein [Lutibaculum baratangense]ESR26716.1 Tricarboxylate transport protein TctC [Lutibaculum baratangense AMV1]